MFRPVGTQPQLGCVNGLDLDSLEEESNHFKFYNDGKTELVRIMFICL